MVGIIGGAIGIILSIAVLAFLTKVLPANMPVRLDGQMILTAVFLSLVAGFVAGVYPAWRICTMPPALQLKLQ